MSAPPPPGAAASALGAMHARRLTLADRAGRLGRWDERLAALRVATFLAALAAWGVHVGHLLPLGPMALALGAAFVAEIGLHAHLAARLRDVRARRDGLDAALARAALDWPQLAGAGRVRRPAWLSAGQRQVADDLDLAGGARSLFALFAARDVVLGGEVLWRWLVAPSTPAATAARQAAARALVPAGALSEDLSSLAAGERAAGAPALDLAALAAWGGAPATRWPGRALWALGVAHLAVVAAAIARVSGHATAAPLIGSWVLQFLVVRALAPRVAATLAAAAGPSRILARAARRLAVLEAAAIDDPLWRAEMSTLAGPGPKMPSARAALARLDRLGRMADAAGNQAVAPLAALVAWTPHVALAMARWQRRHGASLEAWAGALARLEALTLLGGYAREHADDAWPKVAAAPATFVAEGLAHPFLPTDQRVANDLALTAQAPALWVSGSNMSGKSTLLRAVGLAAVMARAGLPVAARRLTLGPLEVATSMRVADSLAAGTSHFWAEVLALKAVCAAAAERPPLLFLLDEILHGTNSRDRTEGARAVLGRLRALGAIGIMTTHDLALTENAAAHGAVNAHFADHIDDGHLAFSYRMRPGVVTASNALALMRLAGIDMDPAEGGSMGG